VTDDTGGTPEPIKDAGESPANPDAAKPSEMGGADSVEGLKSALKTERDARKAGDKRVRELETRLSDFEDRDKTEAERLSARLTDAEGRATEAESQLLRLEIAAQRGLSAEAVALLRGDTREEIEAFADALSAFAKANEPMPPGFDGGARAPLPEQKSPANAHSELVLGLLGRSPSR
jgi:hypothetical protein